MNFIHVGFYRTATTTFQNNIMHHIKNLSVFDPYSKECKKLYEYLFDLNKKNFKVRLKNCRKYFKSNKNFFVSDEGIIGKISNNFHDVGIRLKFFDKLFDRPTYILTIRSQKTMLFSSWLKSLDKKKYSFGEYISKNQFKYRTTQSLSEPFYYKILNYYRILKPYYKIRKRVKILIFENLLEDQNYYFDQTLNLVGKKNFNIKKKKIYKIHNQSKFSLKFNKIMYLPRGKNKIYHKSKYLKLIDKLSLNNPLNKFFIFLLKVYNYQNLRKIFNYHKKYNQKFDKQWKLNLKKFNYY